MEGNLGGFSCGRIWDQHSCYGYHIVVAVDVVVVVVVVVVQGWT